MPLAKQVHVTYEEYLTLKAQTQDRLEYIDGVVCMSPSPSTRHQRISGRLYAKLYNHLVDSECEVFSAPFDILLQTEEVEGKRCVIPDLSVICDPSGFTENNYVGVPVMIIEILSPSNQAHELVTKLNLYMRYGVKEYWIVNPMLKTVMVYNLNADRLYEQRSIKTEIGKIQSFVLGGLEIDIQELFN